MASDLSSFSTAAKGLARNPLGIIALFIVLIYGFAAITLGASSSFESEERLPLVWFLVLFPVLVLFVFVRLVTAHHEKLYAPGDYKTDEGFLEGTRARLRYVEAQAQQNQLKANIRETLIQSGGKVATAKQDLEVLMNLVSSEIDRSTTITVDARDFLGDPSEIFHLPVSAIKSVNDLTDSVYFKLAPAIAPYTYGHSWWLRNQDSGEVLRNARMITGTAAGLRIPDWRTLGEVDIKAGDVLVVEKPQTK
jgi:hypothetical protein